MYGSSADIFADNVVSFEPDTARVCTGDRDAGVRCGAEPEAEAEGQRMLTCVECGAEAEAKKAKEELAGAQAQLSESEEKRGAAEKAGAELKTEAEKRKKEAELKELECAELRREVEKGQRELEALAASKEEDRQGAARQTVETMQAVRGMGRVRVDVACCRWGVRRCSRESSRARAVKGWNSWSCGGRGS